jgi:hypothetical protein
VQRPHAVSCKAIATLLLCVQAAGAKASERLILARLACGWLTDKISAVLALARPPHRYRYANVLLPLPANGRIGSCKIGDLFTHAAPRSQWILLLQRAHRASICLTSHPRADDCCPTWPSEKSCKLPALGGFLEAMVHMAHAASAHRKGLPSRSLPRHAATKQPKNCYH